jgi:predicted nucleic acid-binding protein
MRWLCSARISPQRALLRSPPAVSGPAIERLAAASLGGGITYDALILESATEAGASALLTLNERDYDRLDARLEIVSA